jgi:SAM-dependent methyltransferase
MKGNRMASNVDPSSNSTERYYSDKRQLPTTAQQVGWKNEVAQHRRFRQLSKILPARGAFSVNDLGCGLGAFGNFVSRRAEREITYCGYDIMQDMVMRARSMNANSGFRFCHIRSASEMDAADYSVASGIFNLKGSVGKRAWLSYIIETLHIMHDCSRRGFGFNALTSYSDPPFMRPELYYSDPCELFDYCMRHFSRQVALLHDYREYDFTILVRKE